MRMTRNYKRPYIDCYMELVESGKVETSKEIKQAMPYIRKKLDNPDVLFDVKKTERAVELIERYFYKLVDWELFVVALVHCYYKSTDTVVFDEILIMLGTGNGKNGLTSALAWYFTTEDHGIKNYNVDIIANSEDQAKTSFNDIWNMLDSTWPKTKKFFYKTKEIIKSTKTGSTIKFNTSNAKTRLGKRAGCLIFDEILEYEDWVVYNAFNASFGKIKHSRKFMITTNGYVRGGFLDDQLELAEKVLSGEISDLGFLPLIYKLDEEEEVHDKAKWIKANPSLPYFSNLAKEIEKAYTKMEYQPQLAIDFMTKRMNLPREDTYTAAAPWEKILETNQKIPYDELEGLSCIGAIDYAQITDFASVGLLFKHKGKRYWLEHTFVCHKALKIESRKIKFPVQEMADQGLITIIRQDTIPPEFIAEWFLTQAKKYNVLNIVADSYRVSLLKAKFQEAGLPLKEVRSGPITHAKVAPLVESMFAEGTIIFGDNPTMRWYVNNTYQELDAKGNTTYKKIEPKTRKTDGFFALIHALTQDGELADSDGSFLDLDVYTY